MRRKCNADPYGSGNRSTDADSRGNPNPYVRSDADPDTGSGQCLVR